MVRIEQESTPYQMQELPRGEVIFSKQLTLRELLNLNPESGETGVLLNDVPFNFEVRDLEDSLLHIASFSETQPVSLWELFPLLQTAKIDNRLSP